MQTTRLLWVALLTGFILSLASCANSVTAQTAGLRPFKIEQDGLARRYLLYSPVGVRGFQGSRPLVIVLHGGGGTHRSMVRLTKRRWNRLADQHGFFVAYPNATEKIWDFGEGLISAQRKTRVNDLAFLERMIDEISRLRPIDPTRVFATGISRGGQASFLLGCKSQGRIRAIAPVAMPLPQYFVDDCRAGPPLGVALMMGTEDPIVPYDGGWITVRNKQRDQVISANETIGLFLARSGCGAQPDSIVPIDRAGDATSVTLSEWRQCRDAPVRFYRIENGGHTWPSGRQYLPAFVVGKVSKDIDAADEAWRFFSQF